MAQQIKIKTSDSDQSIRQLLKQVHNWDEPIIVEQDGYPVAVILSYREYEQLGQSTERLTPIEALPPTMTLEEAFGSVSPISQPEDFSALRDLAIEEHVLKTQAQTAKD